MRRAVAAVALAAASCAAPRATLTAVAPPQSWTEELRAERRAKDAAFVRDADSPIPAEKRASFRGLTYFDPDPAWRYAGFVERYPSPERFTIATTSGHERPCEKFGRVTFRHGETSLTLQVYRLLDQRPAPGDNGLFLPFKDKTSGRETYAAGRYVDVEGSEEGPFTVDFNRAYQPSCAYGDPQRFRCPVTPAENTLPLRVEAGEREPSR